MALEGKKGARERGWRRERPILFCFLYVGGIGKNHTTTALDLMVAVAAGSEMIRERSAPPLHVQRILLMISCYVYALLIFTVSQHRPLLNVVHRSIAAVFLRGVICGHSSRKPFLVAAVKQAG